MSWIFRIAAIFLAGTSTVALASQQHSAGEGQQHSSHLSAGASSPKANLAVGAALDDNGRLWLVKVEDQQLQVSWSEDDGKTFSSPATVTPEPENIIIDGESRPKIAVARDGTLLLSWVQALPQKKYAGNIRFSRSTDAGRTFSKPITLNGDGLVTSHRFESLAIDGSGRAVVSWLDARDRDGAKEKDEPFAGVSLYSRQSLDNGATFGRERSVQQHTCECCRTAMTWTKDGPVVLWRNIFGENTRDFAIMNLDKGGIRRATHDEWQIDACPHNGGSLATDRQGQLHLAWFTNGTARQGLFYKRFSPDWESRPMSIGNPDTQANHASVIAEGKTVVLTWREFDGQSYSVQMMHSNDGGVSWGEPMRLMESAGATDYPVPLINDSKVLIVWNTAKEGLRILPIERIVAQRPG